MRYSFLIICLIATAILPDTLRSQEKLVSVGSYPELHAPGKNSPVKTGIPTLLELPFRDDFSGSGLFPSNQYWTDRNALINNTLCLNQPTIGVATLDAMDSTGQIYPHAQIASFLADELTSLPINLFFPLDTTVYFSFYFQAGGHGDMPEADDSLFLEFYAPDSKTWSRVWSKAGGVRSEVFTFQMIHITDSRYLQSGFRFRFRNYASLANSFEPSLKVNADHWHIDYVYLNRQRNYNDNVMQDVALVRGPGSLLLNYTAMPWQHFRQVGITAVTNIFPIHLRNLANQRYFFAPEFSIQDTWGTTPGFIMNIATDEVKSFEELIYDGAFNYGFTSDAADSALFTITLNLKPDQTDWISTNNSVTIRQVFTNYYAYDDGFPEAGYGLVGEGTKNARVACKYRNFYPGDSLIGVQFYFNQSFIQANRKYFRLAIWNESQGKPGEIIYVQDGAVPRFTGGLSGFQLIRLDSAVAPPPVFYVGWIQTSADFLNVGFDRNNNHAQETFIQISGNWQNTAFQGSLMMRPVFSNKSKKTGIQAIRIDHPSTDLRVYPNPASNLISLQLPAEYGKITVRIHDLTGRVVLNKNIDNHQISIADLPNGTYFLQCITDSGQIFRAKFLVAHD